MKPLSTVLLWLALMSIGATFWLGIIFSISWMSHIPLDRISKIFFAFVIISVAFLIFHILFGLKFKNK